MTSNLENDLNNFIQKCNTGKEISLEEFNSIKTRLLDYLSNYKKRLTNKKAEFKTHSEGLKTKTIEYKTKAEQYKQIVKKCEEKIPNSAEIIKCIDESIETLGKWGIDSDEAKYGDKKNSIIHKTEMCDIIQKSISSIECSVDFDINVSIENIKNSVNKISNLDKNDMNNKKLFIKECNTIQKNSTDIINKLNSNNITVSSTDLNIMSNYFKRLKESNDVLKNRTIVEFGSYCNKTKAILYDMNKQFEELNKIIDKNSKGYFEKIKDIGSSAVSYFAENFTSTAIGKVSEAALVGLFVAFGGAQ